MKVHLGIGRTIARKIAGKSRLGGRLERLEYLGELDCLFFLHSFPWYITSLYIESTPGHLRKAQSNNNKSYPILSLIDPNLILSLTDQIPLIDLT